MNLSLSSSSHFSIFFYVKFMLKVVRLARQGAGGIALNMNSSSSSFFSIFLCDVCAENSSTRAKGGGCNEPKPKLKFFFSIFLCDAYAKSSSTKGGAMNLDSSLGLFFQFFCVMFAPKVAWWGEV